MVPYSNARIEVPIGANTEGKIVKIFLFGSVCVGVWGGHLEQRIQKRRKNLLPVRFEQAFESLSNVSIFGCRYRK